MIYTYFTNPDTETIHIAPEGAWAHYHKTLCGRVLQGLVPQDETVTGFSATCTSCKTIIKSNLKKETTDHVRHRDPHRQLHLHRRR